jgi:hypothetical protein
MPKVGPDLVLRPRDRLHCHADALKDTLCFCSGCALKASPSESQTSTQSIRSLLDHVLSWDVHDLKPDAETKLEIF